MTEKVIMKLTNCYNPSQVATRVICALMFLISISLLPMNAEGKSHVKDNQQLYNQMALLSLDCVEFGNSLPDEKSSNIKRVLKESRKLNEEDSSGVYLRNLLDVSYIQFVKKDYKKAYKLSGRLIERFAKDTLSLGIITHFNTPTWDWIHNRSAFKLGKTEFYFSIPVDNSDYGEYAYLYKVLSEIPMSLSNDIYNHYISYYKSVGASNNDIMYFILRCIKYNRCELALKYLSEIKENLSNDCQRNILLMGIYLYATVYNRDYIIDYCCKELNRQNIHHEGITAQNSWNFCLGMISNQPTLYSERDLFIAIISDAFGNTSPEYYWATSRDGGLLENMSSKDKDDEKWTFRIESAQNIADSVAMSTNILKGMSHFENSYDYTSMLDLGKKWENSIILSHGVEYWNGMGLAYRYLGFYDEAIRCFNSAIQLLDTGVPQQAVFLFTKSKENILKNLAYAHCYKGDYALAEDVISIKMPKWNISENNLFREDILHLDDLGRIFSYRNPKVANQYFAFADSLIVNCSAYMSWSNEINHYISWSSLINEPSLKRKYINKAEEILTTKLSSPIMNDPIAEGSIYTSLGRFYYSIFDYKRASEYYDKASLCFLPLRNEDRRKTELVLWDELNRIAMRKTDGIQSILESQLAMQDSLLGANHYDCHQTVKGLLKLAIADNNLELANRYYHRFKNMDGVFGREKHNYGNQLIEASVLSLMGNIKEAYEIADVIDLAECEPSVGLQALEVKQSMVDNLPVRIKTTELQNINNAVKLLSARLFTEVSGQDRVEWARQLGTLKSRFISEANTAAQIENALDFSLFTKGLLFRTNKHIISLIGRTKNGQKSLQELFVIKDSINHYVALNDTIKISDLRRRYDEREREIISQYLTSDLMLTGLQTGKDNVLKNIGKNGIAIDFVKYSNNDSILYGAFVFAENLPTKFIQLFSEDELCRLTIDEYGKQSYDAFDGKHSNGELYNLVWGNLISFFDDYTDVYFSTDGEIAQIGIEYLTDLKGNSISKFIKPHRVFHLADVTGDIVAGKDILCMGVANHDCPVAHNGDDTDRGLWCNLNCDKEIFDIQNAYKKKKGHKTFLIDDDVNEPFVNSLSNNSSTIIHVSTHGFYYDTDKLRNYARSVNSPDHYLALRFLQSGKSSLAGLVLRKGNEYRKQPILPLGYDDIWTSDEIEGLNFPKLQLTVLSACQTGLGESNGEGVWGLQRAFRIAGTEKLVCALDYVSDKRTREFMGVFYKNLSNGITIYDSFQLARNHLFKRHRDDPRMWSAFVLIE